MTDAEKSATYDAEYELRFVLDNGGTFDFFGSTLVVPVERKFGTVENVQNYIAQVCSFFTVHETFKMAAHPPAVRERRGNNLAHYERLKQVIAVPPHLGSQHSWAMRESVVLHELAHHFTTEGEPHGPAFRGNYARLIGLVIGREAELILMAAYDSRGLSVQHVTTAI